MQVKRIDSSDANVCKYVFEFDKAVAEAVLYQYGSYEERTVVCCSTQSGCPVGCRFCGAGDAFVRSLTSDEILKQVEWLMVDKGIDPSKVKRGQIMFMSMGEPMLNFKELSVAIKELEARYPGFALLISTSAPRVDYEGVRELSQQVSAVGLQFSVHESSDGKRDALIPFKAKLTLAEISAEGRAWFEATGRQPFFNYCAHADNTGPEDVQRLLALFDPSVWQATVSVVCERDESIAAANERQRSLATGFMENLLRSGYSVRCFDPAGQDDIGGGCGQLFHTQKWMAAHPDLARPSIGRSIPIVHMPRVEESCSNR